MFVVDTNVLIHAANGASQSHAGCLRLVQGWRRRPNPWFVTWGILYEFLRVATHPRVFRRPLTASDAHGFVESLLDSPGLSVLVEGERHAVILSALLAEGQNLRGNIMHDVHTAALMQEHGIRVVYTFDTGFHRFPFLEVRDPLR